MRDRVSRGEQADVDTTDLFVSLNSFLVVSQGCSKVRCLFEHGIGGSDVEVSASPAYLADLRHTPLHPLTRTNLLPAHTNPSLAGGQYHLADGSARPPLTITVYQQRYISTEEAYNPLSLSAACLKRPRSSRISIVRFKLATATGHDVQQGISILKAHLSVVWIVRARSGWLFL
jgi:hypothetical protein